MLITMSNQQAAILHMVGLVICVLCALIGTGAPYWYHKEAGHGGIWINCTSPVHGCVQQSPGVAESYIKGCQALLCLSLICQLVAILCHVIWIRSPDSRRLVALCGFANIVAGLLGVAAIMIFGTMYSEKEGQKARGWAFFLTFFADTLLFFLGAKAATKATCMGRNKDKKVESTSEGRWVWQASKSQNEEEPPRYESADSVNGADFGVSYKKF